MIVEYEDMEIIGAEIYDVTVTSDLSLAVALNKTIKFGYILSDEKTISAKGNFIGNFFVI